MLKNSINSPYRGSGQLTREQFLFYEMRTIAKLLANDQNGNKVVDRIIENNLFQYPTEKSVRQMALTCIKRLRAMEDDKCKYGIAK